MKNPFKRKKSFENSNFEQLIDYLNINGVDKSRLSEVTYFACLKILSESIGKLPLKLYQYSDKGGVVKARWNSLYNILANKPNPYMTATHFWSTVEYNRNHYGNAYVLITGAGSNRNLWILPSDRVRILVDDKGIWNAKNAIWYIYTDTSGEMRIPFDSILHFKNSISNDGISGRSTREILSTTFEGNQKAQKMLNSSYENGFLNKAVLQYTGNLDDDKEKIYTKKIQEFVNDSEGKSLIPLMFGTTIQPLNAKLADNEFLGLRKYSALQIASAFGIKPNQINDYEKSSYASAEAQQLAFYVDTLLYIIKQYEEEMNNKLLTDDEIEKGYYIKFNVNVMLRADTKTQLESMKNAVQGALYTTNEAREYLDKPALPGGDVLMCNGNMIPVSMVGQQYMKGGESKNE